MASLASGARAARALSLAAGLWSAAPLASPPPAPAEAWRRSVEDVAQRLQKAQGEGSTAFPLAAHLTDRIGPRLSGTPGADAAVRWARETLRGWGFESWTEPVRVVRWVRGAEEAELLAPVVHRLAVTALGGSIATAPEGLSAEVVEAHGMDALAALPEEAVRGRVVLLNQPISEGGYGNVMGQRTRGAAAAAKKGALGVLVRSIGSLAARLPHTGQVRYEVGVTPIPAAAVASEDADLIHRLLKAGEAVKVRLRLGCRSEGEVDSANVLAEIKGREKPEEVVVLGAHLDSWDLATGAIDDAAGVAMVMETLRLLKAEGLQPRRTLRLVLFMNEENGLRGAEAYAQQHAAEAAHHVAALEADSGSGRPLGLAATAGEGGLALLEPLAASLAGHGIEKLSAGGGGADLTRLREKGVPVLTVQQDTTRYFDWHHTAADTLDKIDPADLARMTVAIGSVAWGLAEMPQTLPRLAPEATAAH